MRIITPYNKVCPTLKLKKFQCPWESYRLLNAPSFVTFPGRSWVDWILTTCILIDNYPNTAHTLIPLEKNWCLEIFVALPLSDETLGDIGWPSQSIYTSDALKHTQLSLICKFLNRWKKKEIPSAFKPFENETQLRAMKQRQGRNQKSVDVEPQKIIAWSY